MNSMKQYFKPILILLLFCTVVSVSQTASAVSCPDVSEWTHIKGQPWQLGQHAQQEGWEPSTLEGAKESELTNLPADTHLLVGLMNTGARFTTCGYSLQKGDHSKVIAAINTKNRVNLKSLKGPFYLMHSRWFCDTQAGQPQTCQWEWSS